MAVPAGAGTFPACSDWSRSQGLRPVGSAGAYDGFLLVEQPLPWPEDIGAAEGLAPLAPICSQHNVRLQAILGAGGSPAAERRLILYRRAEPGWSGPLVRAEAVAGEDQVAGMALAMLGSSAPAGATGPTGWPAPTGWPGAGVQDILVCTHGRRDACCGAKGTQLFLSLAASLVDESMSPVDMRLWRTSHTGGHRFAPTAVVLPEGSLWAYVDEHLARALSGAGPWRDSFWARYRGCALLGGAGEQALEGAVGAVVGRGLLFDRRRVEVVDEHGHLRLLSDSFGVWEATVVPGRRVPQPDCRADPEAARKFSTEWQVEGLRRVEAPSRSAAPAVGERGARA